MADGDFYEVQFREPEGNTAGHWVTIAGMPQRCDQGAAELLRAELEQSDPESLYRVVPWGTGPGKLCPATHWPSCPHVAQTLDGPSPVMRCALTGKHPDGCQL